MKYIRIILAAGLLALLMTGCDNDDSNINTLPAAVGFKETSITIKETVDFVTIPIVVENDVPRDGDIIVHATMKSSNAGFEKSKDIIITTETLRIPPQLNSINFEIGLRINTLEMNPGRYVEFEITGAQGASVGSGSICRFDITERNFVEGQYNVKGLDIEEYPAGGKISIIAADETLDNVMWSWGIGGSAKITFTEIVPELEYDIEIAPFQFVGIYSSLNVYMTWMKKEKEDTDPETMEYFRGAYYDRTQPIKGKFKRTLEDGREKSLVFTIEDAFGLLGELDGVNAWFNTYSPNATLTKID